ncbi:MAG: PepSY domain-containing protein [Acidobacteriota bacterium]|nr:PepSY domain-containing protein [Acidobacteriota bacterium]
MKSRKSLIAKLLLSSLMIAGIVGVSSANLFAQEKEEKQDKNLARQAKISMAKAREIAHAKAAGKIEGEELEKEHGKLIYSFDIRNAKGTITEVQVDAKTGAIVSVEEENKAAEQKEKQAEKREKSKKKKS